MLVVLRNLKKPLLRYLMFIKFLRLLIVPVVLLLSACSTNYPNQAPLGKTFPTVQGESLAKAQMQLPNDFPDQPVILLLGYVQDAQFDIDRWLIGLDMKQVTVPFYELPTIQGMVPRMFKAQINNGMRAGIPESLWQGVITIYEGGEQVQQFTGNDNPNNARVMLLDRTRKIRFFYDDGFSVVALNELIETYQSLQK